jgi:hypothetical protein
MDRFEEIHSIDRPNNAVMLFEKDSEIHVNHHPPTLDDVQRLARRIHHEHGGVTGGHTLDDWLEAEHELEDMDGSVSENNQVH